MTLIVYIYIYMYVMAVSWDFYILMCETSLGLQDYHKQDWRLGLQDYRKQNWQKSFFCHFMEILYSIFKVHHLSYEDNSITSKLRIKRLFFNLHDVMKTVGGVKIP